MMELLLLRLTDSVLTASQLAAEVAQQGSRVPIGFIVLGVIVGPVLLLTLAAIIEMPKKTNIPQLFLGAFALLIGAMVAGFAVISFVLSFFVPQ